MLTLISLPSTHGYNSQIDVRRIRLIVSLSIYGASLGIGALLVSFLAQTKFPNEPEHLEFVPSFIYSLGAAVVGAVLAGLITFWTARDASKPRNIFVLILMGFAFGVFLPFTTGFTLPLSTLLLNLEAGIVGGSDLLPQLVSAIFQGPSFAFVHGVFGLFTGMLAGALFAAGALIIDWVNASNNNWLSKFGAYVIAIILALAIVSVAAFGPAAPLAKLG